MSMNLKLRFKDKKDRSIKDIDLIQTPTEVTYSILEEKTFEDQLLAYIEYVSKFDDSTIEDIPTKFHKAVEDGIEQFDLTTYQSQLSVSTMIEEFLPYSMKEYRRLEQIIKEYYDDYEPEFFAI